MARDRLQQRSDRLATRVEALAAALRDSSVPEEASAELMSRASAAALEALSLELLLEPPEPLAA
jgi:hypothetical protein